MSGSSSPTLTWCESGWIDRTWAGWGGEAEALALADGEAWIPRGVLTSPVDVTEFAGVWGALLLLVEVGLEEGVVAAGDEAVLRVGLRCDGEAGFCRHYRRLASAFRLAGRGCG